MDFVDEEAIKRWKKAKEQIIFSSVAIGIFLLLGFYWLSTNFAPVPTSLNEQLQAQVDRMNATCPRMISKDVRFDGVALAPDRNYLAHYTFVNAHTGQIDGSALQARLRPTYLDAYRRNPNLNLFREEQYTLHTQFFDADGKMITEIVTGPDDMQ